MCAGIAGRTSRTRRCWSISRIRASISSSSRLWPQEVYYFTGLLILASLALFLSNALFGRVWCGYFCPQTVWTDLFLWVERFFEGDRRDRIKLDAAPWTRRQDRASGSPSTPLAADRLVDRRRLGALFRRRADAGRQLATLQAPLAAYVWIGILTFTTYYLAGHMREQVCLYMCPWPRIQAALTDIDALNVTYRRDRGEPRMSLKDAARAHAAASRPATASIATNASRSARPASTSARARSSAASSAASASTPATR